MATSIFMSFPPGGSFFKSSKKIMVALIASYEEEKKKVKWIREDMPLKDHLFFIMNILSLY